MIHVWGLGSIGRRHLANLGYLGENRIGIIRRDTKNTLSGAEGVWTPDDVDWSSVSALIIATPTSLHLSNLETALKHGVRKIYLEKPISHNNDRVDEMSSLIESCGANVYIGFDLRYDPGVRKVKELVESRALGAICSIHAHVGQYLPDWRPGQDYRNSMSASPLLGGGVMLDLTHELDYMVYLFGEISSVANSNGRRSNLEIEVEDTSDSLLFFRDGFSGTVHLDYLQKWPTRHLHVIGSEGTLLLDLHARKLIWNSINSRSQEMLDYSECDRNDRFRAILSDFISANPSDRLCTWDEGRRNLTIVVESKLASSQMSIREISSS